MKKLFLIVVIFSSVMSCTSTKVSSPNAAGRPASDTALQGDSMKTTVKP